ncbi:MAG: hypothetical protein V3W19_13945 [Desulfatiglandales bacterium]
MEHKPKMTAKQAKEFDTISEKNYLMVKALLASKSDPCQCEPYKDVFTYGRWKAQGYQVQRGSKAIKAPLVKRGTKEVEHPTTGEKDIKHWRVMTVSYLFCRCQVKRK